MSQPDISEAIRQWRALVPNPDPVRKRFDLILAVMEAMGEDFGLDSDDDWDLWRGFVLLMEGLPAQDLPQSEAIKAFVASRLGGDQDDLMDAHEAAVILAGHVLEDRATPEEALERMQSAEILPFREEVMASLITFAATHEVDSK